MDEEQTDIVAWMRRLMRSAYAQGYNNVSEFRFEEWLDKCCPSVFCEQIKRLKGDD